ncbi:hypothetical protein F4803DRAFT_536965, partial [Xylaria telfairii]
MRCFVNQVSCLAYILSVASCPAVLSRCTRMRPECTGNNHTRTLIMRTNLLHLSVIACKKRPFGGFPRLNMDCWLTFIPLTYSLIHHVPWFTWFTGAGSAGYEMQKPSRNS